MIQLLYPARRLIFLGWRVHWLVIYLVLSISFGLLLMPVFKVEL